MSKVLVNLYISVHSKVNYFLILNILTFHNEETLLKNVTVADCWFH